MIFGTGNTEPWASRGPGKNLYTDSIVALNLYTGQLVWGYQDLGTGHLIDVHIGRLRLKLRRVSRSAPVIVTVRGKGYTIASEGAEAAAGSEHSTEASPGV